MGTYEPTWDLSGMKGDGMRVYEAIKDYNGSKTIRELAAEFRRHPSAMHTFCKRYRLKTKPAHQRVVK